MPKKTMIRTEFPKAIPPAGPAKALVGSWQLIKADFPPSVAKIRGEHPQGMLVYDVNGYMTVQISPGHDHPIPDRYPPTKDECYDSFLGFVSYYGTYSVDWENQLVTHHRIFMAPPADIEQPFIRKFELIDDQNVTLRPLESDNILYWQRLR